FPDRLAALLIKGDDGSAAAAGSDDQVVAIHQRRLADAPMRDVRVEAFHEVGGPDRLAGSLLEADQLTVGGKRVKDGAVERRRAARAVSALLVVGLACRCLPDFLARLRVDGDDIFLIAVLPLCEQEPTGDGE